jgi:hypothetical protein
MLYVTEEEKALLLKLAEIPFLPLTRFVMKRADSDESVSVAQAPVFLNDQHDSADAVKKTGDVLLSLEDKYLITLDYDLPLTNGDYSMYEKSRLYRDFCEALQKGIDQDGVTYSLPMLQRGSMALTALGQDALDSIE